MDARNPSRFAVAAGALALLVGGLTACTGAAPSGSSGSSGSSDPSASVIAPVSVALDEVDGTTVTVQVGNVVNLTGDDETFADWTADVDDPEVVSFVGGRTDGSATFNPGLKALEVGDSDVTLTNSSTGATVSFEVEVTAAG